MARIANCDFNLFVCSPDGLPFSIAASRRHSSPRQLPTLAVRRRTIHYQQQPIFDNFENRVVLQGLCRKQNPGAGG